MGIQKGGGSQPTKIIIIFSPQNKHEKMFRELFNQSPIELTVPLLHKKFVLKKNHKLFELFLKYRLIFQISSSNK